VFVLIEGLRGRRQAIRLRRKVPVGEATFALVELARERVEALLDGYEILVEDVALALLGRLSGRVETMNGGAAVVVGPGAWWRGDGAVVGGSIHPHKLVDRQHERVEAVVDGGEVL